MKKLFSYGLSRCAQINIIICVYKNKVLNAIRKLEMSKYYCRYFIKKTLKEPKKTKNKSNTIIEFIFFLKGTKIELFYFFI